MPWEVNDLTFDVIEGCPKEVIEVFFRVLGEKYEDTLVTKQADRRGIYYNSGDYMESLASLRLVHRKLLRYFLPQNIFLLHIFSITANMLNYSEMYIEALEMLKTVLQLKLELKLDEHESTLAVRHNIALVLFNLQNYTEAIELALEVFVDKSRILGLTHASTAKTERLIVDIVAIMSTYI
jgi:tetratricopeptide (TPR) repeat protein